VRCRVEPDWAELARELKRPGVNMMVLWEEYRAAHPDGYGYSRFCDLFRGFERRLIEIFHRGQRVGVHERRYGGPRHGTDPTHMPSSHRRYAEWTPDRFRRWAARIGPNTEGLIAAVLASRRHPEQGFRTCLGVLKLYRGVDPARVETVSARALEIGAFNCKSIAALLARKSGASAARDGVTTTLFDHANLRGPGYYH